MTKPQWVTVRMTAKQAQAADAALGNLMARAEEYADIDRPLGFLWEQEALWRLRAQLISAVAVPA